MPLKALMIHLFIYQEYYALNDTYICIYIVYYVPAELNMSLVST